MQKYPQVTQTRIRRFIDWTLAPLIWKDQVVMQASMAQPDHNLDPSLAHTVDYAPINPGQAWGPIWSNAWFKLEAQVPEQWAGKPLVARIELGSEATVWDGSNPVQGIDHNHRELNLTDCAESGHVYTLYVRATGMNPNVQCEVEPWEPSSTPFVFQFAFLNVVNDPLLQLYWDVSLLLDIYNNMPDTEQPRKSNILYAMNDAVNQFDENDADTIAAAREAMASVYDTPAHASSHQITAIGNSHIDSAWLWPIERTQHKCMHTFSTVLNYMKKYPEYRFLASQAVQYQWIKDLAPELFERIKKEAQEGNWEVAGSMWVEADCNITGGESLVRQVVYAKRFWMQEFGIETVELWLPDVFGYSAALPQILKKSGVDYFLTQKISWNQFNRFPHSSFMWKGIDGTEIFSHFPPVDTYVAGVNADELYRAVKNYGEHDRANMSVMPYGHGDGGGGPTIEMLERLRRLKDFEGLPKVEQGTIRGFFEDAIKQSDDWPVWVGELYLEVHRGTYTTQARTKKGNRKSEFLLRDAEFFALMTDPTGASYPHKVLEDAWKKVLLNQFHDIIPGSSINEVYKDAEAAYAEIEQTGLAVVNTALGSLATKIDTTEMENPVMVTRNLDGFVIGSVAKVPLPDGFTPKSVSYDDDTHAVVQIINEDGQRCALFSPTTEEDGHGYTVYDLSTKKPGDEGHDLSVNNRLIDNGVLRVEFDENGLISQIFDYEVGRNVMHEGDKGNLLRLHDDKPNSYDAWDIDLFYKEKYEDLTSLDSVKVIEQGPIRAALRFERSFGSSHISQIVRLAAGSRRIEFVTDVDWHERRKLLKVGFPVEINSSRATYEIQYGSAERPTHMNTSWDMARFEVCAQKWADLSEGDYGVALINDCKYGYDILGRTLRLSLLRSPKAPDPQADMGHHRFTYALMPHLGDYTMGGVVEHAYDLNSPSRVMMLQPNQPGMLPKELTVFQVDREGVMIECIKRAEDDNSVIVRLYDAWNSRGPVVLTTPLDVKRASLVDLMEREISEIDCTAGDITLEIRPFEIQTIKLELSDDPLGLYE